MSFSLAVLATIPVNAAASQPTNLLDTASVISAFSANSGGSSNSTTASHQAVTFAAKDYQNTTIVSDKQVQFSLVNDQVSTENNSAGPSSIVKSLGTSPSTSPSTISETNASHEAVNFAAKDLESSSTTSDKQLAFSAVNDHIKTETNTGGHGLNDSFMGNPGTSSETDASHQAVTFAAKDYYNKTEISDKQLMFSMVRDHISSENHTGGYGDFSGLNSFGNHGSSNETDASHLAINFAAKDSELYSTTHNQDLQFSMVNDHVFNELNTGRSGCVTPAASFNNPFGNSSSTAMSHQAVNFLAKDYFNQTTILDKQLMYSLVNDQISSSNNLGGFPFGGLQNSTNASHLLFNFAAKDFYSQSTTMDKQIMFSMVNDNVFNHIGNGFGGMMPFGQSSVLGLGAGSMSTLPSMLPLMMPLMGSSFGGTFSSAINLAIDVNVQVNVAMALSMNNSFDLLFI